MTRRLHAGIRAILLDGFLDPEPTQRQLSRDMGLSQGALSQWVREPLQDGYRGAKTDEACERYLDTIGFPRESLEEQAVEQGTGERREFKIRGDEATCVVFTSDLIRTEQDALDASEVNMEVWEDYQLEFGAWGSPMKLKRDGEDVPVTVQLYRVAIKFRRKVMEPLLKELAAGLIEDLRGLVPSEILPSFSDKGNHLLAVCTPDIHHGKVPFDVFDKYDAPALHDEAVSTLLHRSASAFDVGQIVFPVGNDALNTDGSRRATTRGTPQDGLGRWQQEFRQVVKMYVSAIQKMLEVAPVHVITVPGNHDEDAVFYLGEVLASIFASNDAVTLDVSLDPRKYYARSGVLLGFTHGKEGKLSDLPMLMAVESPKDWAKASTRHWLTGHRHKKDVESFKGVQVRISPSLAPADEWHRRKGFVGNVRAAEAIVYSKKHKEAEFLFTA